MSSADEGRRAGTLPKAGQWRMYLQFQTGGEVHTAAVTLDVRQRSRGEPVHGPNHRSAPQVLGAVDGVQTVDVVLETGRLTVTSAAALTVEAGEAAVDEAGYTLVH